MKYTGLNEENGLLILKFKNDINHYVFIVIAYAALVSLRFILVDGVLGMSKDLIMGIAIVGVISSIMMYIGV